jgi:Mg-chelatase subunit ChlD
LKATSKFLIKGIYLILLIVTIAIVTNQIITVNYIGLEESENIEFRKEASNILENLLSSDKCLTIKNMETTEKIINISTLDEFQSKYSDIEPDCARNYEYGYYVKIEKFNLTKISGFYEPKIPPGNRDIVLILDNSASMDCNNACPERFSTLKSAAIQFVKCADKETDRVAIIVFSNDVNELYCGVSEEVPMTSLSSEQNIKKITDAINGLDAEYGTPLISSLKEAERILSAPGIQDNKMVILFTDGRETCCEACTGSKGTSDCLGPCQDKLCDFATGFKNNNIPVYSIFLGNDPIGIQQTKCVSEQTGGNFYNISAENIDILPKLFCEIVSKERETTEDYQSWYFGSHGHSRDNALKGSVLISLPVSIKITDTKTQPGLATIMLFKGELEELVGSIDRTCETGLETRKKIYISYPVKLKENSICMNNAGRMNCRKFACNLDVKFEGINSPGMYEFYFKKEGNTLKVIV